MKPAILRLFRFTGLNRFFPVHSKERVNRVFWTGLDSGSRLNRPVWSGFRDTASILQSFVADLRKRTLTSLPPPLRMRLFPNIPPVAMSNSRIRVGEQIQFDFQEAAEEIPGGKAGILFSTENAKYLYLFNLGSTEPILKIELDSALGFCMFKSKLFAFDHCDPKPKHKHRHSSIRNTGQSVYHFDIPSKWNLGDMKLSKKDMSRVCRMRGSKCFPKALPSPDGKKMVIFSSMISLSTQRPSDCHFELFDLEQGKCIEKLPCPSFFNSDNEDYHRDFAMIKSFAFINTHTFFILTDGLEIFSIDLDESIKKRFWEKWQSFSGRSPSQLPLASFFILGQNICCLGWNACFNIDFLDKDVPYKVSVFEEDACHYTYPELSSFPTADPEVLNGGAVIVGEDAGKVKLCIMRAFGEDFGGEDFSEGDDDLDYEKISLSVDVYICDLAECSDGVRQDLAKKRLENERERKKKKKKKMFWKPMILPGIKKVGSIKIWLDPKVAVDFRQENFFAMLP